MHPRLLCFLSDIEQFLVTDGSEPATGQWETTRTVNYHLDLARLVLNLRTGSQVEPQGAIHLQAFSLADGTFCLKTALSWTGKKNECGHVIYARPRLNWKDEAQRMAAIWLAGPPAEATVEATPDAIPVRLATTG